MEEKLPQKVERAPVKQDEKPKRYVEKGRDVIFDNKTRVYWMKKIHGRTRASF